MFASLGTLTFLFLCFIQKSCEGIASCAPNPCHNRAACRTINGTSLCQCPREFVGDYCQYPNPCVPHSQCQNGGTCAVQITESHGVGFLCTCPVGYSASLCEVSVPNACDSDPCKNHGTCHLLSLTDFHCICPNGYQGKTCEEIDHCAANPCRNGGTCTSSAVGFQCACPNGFVGETCTTDIDECKDLKPCVTGQCVNLHGSYQCQCPETHTGRNCETLFIPCHPSPCLHDGVCIPYGTFKYHCQCANGFSGKNCERNEDNCQSHLCQNGGRCLDGINNYTCECKPNYRGKFCTEDVDECVLHPNICQNQGTCTNTVGGFHCICVNGWEGQFCEKNTDDCVGNPCLNGGICHDKVGSFLCVCPPGKVGLLCHLDDACISNPCQGSGAICSTNPVDGSYLCSCPKGFYGVDCSIDRDECAEKNPCEHGGTCINTPGSYTCGCPTGWTGRWCTENVNECASNPCKNGATCLDDVGRYICVCMPGFTSHDCSIDIDECSLKKDACKNGGICRDMIGGYNCTCTIGFTGADCSLNIDECKSNPCLNGGECLDSIGGFQCKCPAGTTGTLCSDFHDECLSNPCHRGKCVDAFNSYTCKCDPGFTGKNCEINVNECASQPCQHNATCTDLENGYYCTCPRGYYGPRCENDINMDECTSSPCKNGALCIDTVARFICICTPGFTGFTCDTELNECSSNPCENGGKCHDRRNGYVCECPRGYNGTRCHQPINECLSNPCQHSVACIDAVGRFVCVCLPGYTGTFCETNVNDCAAAPCGNDGSCIDLANGYHCTCKPGFYGRNCELIVDACSSGPCLHGGKCVSLAGTYECSCAPKWSGGRCETFIGSDTKLVSTPTNRDMTPYQQELALDKIHCAQNHCDLKRNDGICNLECNLFACDMDGTDCSGGLNPYKDCKDAAICAKVRDDGQCDMRCYTEDCLWDGGDCDPKPGVCNPLFLAYCERHYHDGNCDSGCNNTGCSWDGGDCFNDRTKKPEVLTGQLIVILLIDEEAFRNKSNQFLMTVSRVLGVSLHIKRDDSGKQMIYPWNSENGVDVRSSGNSPAWPKRGGGDSVVYSGTMVVLEVDVSQCVTEGRKSCFTQVSRVAEFLGAEVANQKLEKAVAMPIYSISTNGDTVDPPRTGGPQSKDTIMGTVLALIGAAALIFLLIMVLIRKRKIQAPLWIPEGWSGKAPSDKLRTDRVFVTEDNVYQKTLKSKPSFRRHNPDGSEAVVKNLGQYLDLDDASDYQGGVLPSLQHCDSGQWSDTETCTTSSGIYASNAPKNSHYQDYSQYGCGMASQFANYGVGEPSAKRFQTMDSGYGGLVVNSQQPVYGGNSISPDGSDLIFTDNVTYRLQHPKTALNENTPWLQQQQTGVHLPILRQQQNGAANRTVLTARRQDGLQQTTNPVCKQQSTPTTLVDNEHTSLEEDCYQEADATPADLADSALHLAVQCARPSAVKKLLDAGANPNVFNGQGLTPLHLAVATFNTDVVQMLLSAKDMDVDVKSQTANATDKLPEEFTPLIYALRFYKGDNDILQLLLNANASVAATDKDGKTALHWAAFTDICSAIDLLIANGANKDAQDIKDQTPLFLAAMEGNYDACERLLALGASKDITDKEDRQARDVAEAGFYRSIVILLDSAVKPAMPPSLGDNNAGTFSRTTPTANSSASAQNSKQAGNAVVKPKPPRRTKSLREPKPPAAAAVDANILSSGTATIGRRKTSVPANRQSKRCIASEKDSLSSASSGRSPANSVESPAASFVTTPSPASMAQHYPGQILGVYHGDACNSVMAPDDSPMNCATISSQPQYFGNISHYQHQQSPPNYGQSPYGSPSTMNGGTNHSTTMSPPQAYMGSMTQQYFQQSPPSLYGQTADGSPPCYGQTTTSPQAYAGGCGGNSTLNNNSKAGGSGGPMSASSQYSYHQRSPLSYGQSPYGSPLTMHANSSAIVSPPSQHSAASCSSSAAYNKCSPQPYVGNVSQYYQQSPPNYGQSPPQYFADPHSVLNYSATAVHHGSSAMQQQPYGNLTAMHSNTNTIL